MRCESLGQSLVVRLVEGQGKAVWACIRGHKYCTLCSEAGNPSVLPTVHSFLTVLGIIAPVRLPAPRLRNPASRLGAASILLS